MANKEENNNTAIERFHSTESSVDVIISKAVENTALDIGVLERLISLRERVNAQAAKEAFFEAKAEFQRIRPSIPKRHKVYDRGGNFRYKYAKLDDITEAIKKPLAECGLSYEWKMEFTFENGKNFELSSCIVTHNAGHSEVSVFKVPVDFATSREGVAIMTAAQSYGSASTFAKRYSLCNALGITPDEDDDGATAGKVIDVESRKQPQPKATKPVDDVPPPPADDDVPPPDDPFGPGEPAAPKNGTGVSVCPCGYALNDKERKYYADHPKLEPLCFVCSTLRKKEEPYGANRKR